MRAASALGGAGGPRLEFHLPRELEASEPPERRGLTRDGVRLMVAYRSDLRIVHSTFDLLPTFLEPDDLLVINTSATLPAAVTGVGPDGTVVVVHLSSHLDGEEWVVEPRRPAPAAQSPLEPPPADRRAIERGGFSERWPEGGAPPPTELALGEDGSSLKLLGPWRGSTRLWRARLRLPVAIPAWLASRGRPIRYSYVTRPWPLAAYQNVYADEPGSAEMPSAGRPFTPEMITRLVARGVGVAPVVLHTGVASLDADEVPYPERFRVPAATARRVNETRAASGRVVAVGTTTVRALESAWDADAGRVAPADGWTDLVITPERGVAVVDGMLTGWHEPQASHLLMLAAVAGRELLEESYQASLAAGYLWHEFGDVHLILP
jgi:S-adenosylmethionine:tRNA ribosyltransferase-isomerase